MSNSQDDRCTRHDGEDGTAETLGDALGPGVTKDDLADTERVLKRFEAVAVDEFDDNPDWLTTAHRAVCTALRKYEEELPTYDSELGQQPEPDYDPMRCSGCGNTEFHIPMVWSTSSPSLVCCESCGRVTSAVGDAGTLHRGKNINDLLDS